MVLWSVVFSGKSIDVQSDINNYGNNHLSGAAKASYDAAKDALKAGLPALEDKAVVLSASGVVAQVEDSDVTQRVVLNVRVEVLNTTPA